MRLTESALRNIVKEEIQSLKESQGANWRYETYLDHLVDALDYLREALAYSRKSPMGEDEQLVEITESLEDIIDAVLPLADPNY